MACLARESTRDLLRRPAPSKALEHGSTQDGIAFEARTHPAPRLRLLLRVAWLITDLSAAIAAYLSRDR